MMRCVLEDGSLERSRWLKTVDAAVVAVAAARWRASSSSSLSSILSSILVGFSAFFDSKLPPMALQSRFHSEQLGFCWIYMCAELDQFDNVMEVFDEMPERDVVSSNVTISGCIRCLRFREAVGVLVRSQARKGREFVQRGGQSKQKPPLLCHLLPRRMSKESNEKPNEAIVVSTLYGLELGKEIHDCRKSKQEREELIEMSKMS